MSTSFRKVLFLCTGNYYRSRFAEELFNALARENALAWRAESRGLQLCPGNEGPISHFTVEELQRLGIPQPGEFRHPRSLQESDLREAHLVVGVKELEHRPLLTEQFPSWVERVEFWQIDDIDCAEPVVALRNLARQVRQLTAKLLAAAVEKHVALTG